VPAAATPWGRPWADYPQGDRASQGVQSVEDHPRSWGTPSVRSPCSVDAGRTAITRPLRCRSAAPGITKARAPTRGLSTLNSMAFGLAVRASRCGLPAPRAGLASSCWSGSTGRAFHPQGPDERFRRVYDISSSSPKLAWRNGIDRSIRRKLSQLDALLYACHPHFVNGYPATMMRTGRRES
jgi:hypothetical protein